MLWQKAKKVKYCCLKMIYVSVPGCSSLSLKGRPRKRKGRDGQGSDQLNNNNLSESWMERMKVCCGVCYSICSIDLFMNTDLMAKQDVLRFWTNSKEYCDVTECFLFCFNFEILTSFHTICDTVCQLYHNFRF